LWGLLCFSGSGEATARLIESLVARAYRAVIFFATVVLGLVTLFTMLGEDGDGARQVTAHCRHAPRMVRHRLHAP
jgi:hypothetical protein